VIQRLLPETERFLSNLVRIPSISGEEDEAMEFLFNEFQQLDLDVEKIALSNKILEDPDYSDPVKGLNYDGRFNLRLCRPGKRNDRRILLNTHVDVVPPSEEMDDPWSGRIENGILFGRGACDAKGQVATIHLLLAALEALQPNLRGGVLADLVVEEENGGNGTLAMIRSGVEADACVVLEPSDGKLYTSIRGAVWFRLVLSGESGHSGQAGQTRSALLMARDAIGILEEYHDSLLQSSRGHELFDPYPNPMPITFGRLHAGNWPASTPSRAVIEGVLGLLPNKTKEEVCREMQQTLVEKGGEYLAENCELTFMYRHDSSVLDPNHELPQALLSSAGDVGVDVQVSGMTASCAGYCAGSRSTGPSDPSLL